MTKLVLFDEDWENSEAIIHANTKNVSFIEYANLLRKMGIKNYGWCLQLHNPELLNIDPFSPDLTKEQMALIRDECSTNPFYYFREIARAPGHTAENPKRLRANRGNMSLYWLFLNKITTYLIQIRQTGKSLSMDHLAIYLNNLYYQKKLVNLLTKDDKLRQQNMDRIRELEQYLPFYLSGHAKGDVNNTEEIYYGATGNRFKGHVPATSDKFANNVARGFTAPTYLIDEFAFLRFVAITIPAMLAGGNDARAEAELDGLFYGTVFATTAGKKDDKDGAYAYSLVMGAADWSESFLDAKDHEHLRLLIQKATPNYTGYPEVHCAFNHRQLGKTDEWLRTAMAAAKATGEAADRDYGNVWTDGSRSSPLTVEEARRIRASERIYFGGLIEPWPFTIRWQIIGSQVDAYMDNNKVIMSLDPSEQIGRDDSSINLRDVKTGKVIGAATINEASTIETARFIAYLLVRYRNITWIPENKLNGSTIIDYVLMELVAKGIDPFRRIFNLVVDESDEFKQRYKDICTNGRVPKEFISSYRRHFGFKTSASGKFSRDGLYGSVFMAAVKYTGDSVHDSVTISQLMGLVTVDGRIDHPEGGKDDAVIAWLLTFWFLTNAKNLQHYGIDPKEVLSINNTSNEEKTPDKLYERYVNNQIKSRINDVARELSEEKDPHIVDRLEAKLRNLEYMLSDADRKILAIDDLITQLRQNRRRLIKHRA